MKKKLILLLAVAFALCAMTACSDTKTDLPEASSVQESGQTEENKDGVAGQEEEQTVKPGFSAEEDLAVLIDGKNYGLRIDSAELISVLGEDYDYSEVISCVYDGQDKTYEYEDITISTVPVEGKDLIEVYTLKTDKYSTAKGAKVGMTKDEILAIYGEECFDDGYMTYSTTNDENDIQAERIQLYLEEGKVVEIYVYSPSY